MKNAALRAYDIIGNMRQVAATIFNVATSTISYWNSHREHQMHHPGRPRIFNNHLISFIRDALFRNPFLTCNNLRDMIYHSFSLIVSRQSISSCIHKAGLSKKKTRLCYMVPHNKDEMYKNMSIIYLSALSSFHKIVAIDETGFQDNATLELTDSETTYPSTNLEMRRIINLKTILMIMPA